MLTIEHAQSQIIERILRTKTGELAKVSFLVVEYQGKVRARVIAIEPVKSLGGETSCPTSSNFLIAGKCAKKFEATLQRVFSEFVSPYFELNFLMSQPTRAPARRT